MPDEVDALGEIVRDANTVRVMGARHSWSQAIVTDDHLVALDRFDRILDVDRDEMTVTVQAGIALKELIAQLETRGLALANLGSIAEQSIAGAMATGTHGTGIQFRCLADQAQRLALVDGRGEQRVLERGDPDFDAVAVGLGAFGIIHEVTLSVVPAFQMHAVTETIPFDDAIEDLDSLVSGHDHLKFWWLVPNEDLIIFRQDRTAEPANDSALQRWFKDEFLAVAVYRPLLALQKIWRDPVVVWTNRVLANAYAKRFERICKSHVAFLTPKPPVHREVEWAFDYANAKELLRTYRKLLLESGHTYNFVQEIRFSRADTFWGSPAYGRDSIWLGVYNIDSGDRWADQVRQFEAFAREHGGRPHWGKEANTDPDYLATHCPKLAAFEELRATYDPDDKFLNPWLARILGQ